MCGAPESGRGWGCVAGRERRAGGLAGPRVLFRHNEQSQSQTVENGKHLVESHGSLAIFQPRHEIDGDAEQSGRIVDAQVLCAASFPDHRTQSTGGGERDDR